MSDYGSTNKQHTHLSSAERDMLQADRPGYGTRSIIEVGFNLVNATVGAGIMGLPFAISRAGLGFGFLASIWVAILSQLGLYMLILAGQRIGVYKYAMVVEHAMGSFGYHILNLMIIVQAGGSCVSYTILLGDTMPCLLEKYLPQYPLLSNRTLVVSAISICCILPLNMRRSIGSLARWSILAVMCLPVILMTILMRAPAYYDRTPERPKPSFTWFGSDIFSALGIMAFAFTCAQVSFSNFLSLRDQTPKAWRKATITSTSISWFVSMVFALVGFFCFGDQVKSNLFLNFDSDDLIINIGRFALGFSMIFTIPMGFYPTREAVQKSLGFETATRQPSQFQHYTVTFALFFTMLAMGVTIQSLGKVYTLVGGFAATTVAFILPAIVYLVTRWGASSQSSPTLTAAPTLTVAPTLTNYKTMDDKTPLLLPAVDDQSCSSPRIRPYSPAPNTNVYYDEEDWSTVDGADECDLADGISLQEQETPSIQLLDLAAVALILWGFMVMISSTSSVIMDP